MESIENAETSGAPVSCANCGNKNVTRGYRTNLCPECREQFIKYPIPQWIKLFGGAILLLVLFSLFSFNDHFQIGLHLKKGEKAEAVKNYLTAQREFEWVVAKQPEAAEAQAHLLIASFYNEDFNTCFKTFSAIKSHTFNDDKLLREINTVIALSENYFPTDSLNVIIDQYHQTDSIPLKVLQAYITKNEYDVFALYTYAVRLFNQKNYTGCDSTLNKSLQITHYLPAYYLKSSLKRELNQLDSSLMYCDKILALNHESTYGKSSKARTLLKQRKNVEGFNLAKEAYEQSKDDGYAVATLALAYHLNKKTSDMDALLKKHSNDSSVHYYMRYVNDIIAGHEVF